MDIQIEYKGTTKSKITINPNTGRVALKVADIHIGKEETLKKLLQIVLDDSDNFEPFTHRGRIDWYNGEYSVQMVTEDKRFKRTYKMIGE